VLLLQALQPSQVEVQAELRLAAELARQAVARQVGLPGLSISTNAGRKQTECYIGVTCVMAMRMHRMFCRVYYCLPYSMRAWQGTNAPRQLPNIRLCP
jgi:hypothetical protein